MLAGALQELAEVALGLLEIVDGARHVVLVEHAEVEERLGTLGVELLGALVLRLRLREALEAPKGGAEPDDRVVVARLELDGTGEGLTGILVAAERDRDLAEIHLGLEKIRIERDSSLEESKRRDHIALVNLDQAPGVVDGRVVRIEHLRLSAHDLREVELRRITLAPTVVMQESHLVEGRQVVGLDRQRPSQVLERLFVLPLRPLHDRKVRVARGALRIVLDRALECRPRLSGTAGLQIAKPEAYARLAEPRIDLEGLVVVLVRAVITAAR